MKRVGRFLLCLVPTLIVFLASNLISIPVMLVMMIARVVKSEAIADLVAQSAPGSMPDQDMITSLLLDLVDDRTFITDVTLNTLLFYNITAAIGFGLFYMFVMKDRYPAKIKEVYSASSLTGIIVLFAGAEGVLSSVMLIMMQFIPAVFEKYIEILEQSGLTQLSLLSTIVSVILAPIAEEFIFRGITLKLARKFTARFWLANTIQAALFGILHMNLVQGVYAFAMGLLLGYVYSKFHSISATIIAHLSFNFVGTWIESLIYGLDETVLMWKVVTEGLIGAVMCTLGVMLILKSSKTPANVDRFEKEYSFDNPEHC